MKTLKKLVLVAAVICISFTANAQKFGHINFQQLIQVMPESATAQESIKQFTTELDGQFNTMQKEYQTISQEYVAQMENMTTSIRADKENELQAMGQRIQQFQQNAQLEMQQKEQELFQPILTKAREAINEVGKEQGLLYVFNVDALFYNSTESVDLLPLVKSKLNIQ